MGDNKRKNLVDLDQFEVGSNFLELIEFSLVRELPSGETVKGIYGVNVAKVREVVRMPRINPLASRIPSVAGVFELRGVPIPAINLAQVLGDRNAPITADQQIIVTEFSQKRAGFIVATTHRIRRVEWNRVLPPSADSGSCMSGMVLIENNDFLFILDLEKILIDIEEGEAAGTPRGERISSAPIMASVPEPGPDAPGVLLVDDSKMVLNHVGRSLQQNGYRVLTAENGEEALRKLSAVARRDQRGFGPINVVVTDVEMPRMDGLTLTSQLRASNEFGAIPVILHTSLSGSATQAAGQTVGANGYVIKNDINCLLDLLSELIAAQPFVIGA